jgi:hypothetical protein
MKCDTKRTVYGQGFGYSCTGRLQKCIPVGRYILYTRARIIQWRSLILRMRRRITIPALWYGTMGIPQGMNLQRYPRVLFSIWSEFRWASEAIRHSMLTICWVLTSVSYSGNSYMENTTWENDHITGSISFDPTTNEVSFYTAYQQDHWGSLMKHQKLSYRSSLKQKLPTYLFYQASTLVLSI